MTLYRTDLEGYLKDMGYSVTIMDGKNDQNTQTEQINTFLQQGVDVLVINPVQTTSAQTIVDTISPSGTPIVFINREPDKSVLDSYADKCCYVGADARQSGTYQGELILETETQGDINGDGVINSTDVMALFNAINSGDDLDATVADVNGDGVIDARDVMALYNIIKSDN